MPKQCSGRSAVLFLAGFGLGAAAGLLLAPHSGEETRYRINRSVERGKDYVSAQQDAVRRKAQDLMAEGRKRAEALKDSAKSWVGHASASASD